MKTRTTVVLIATLIALMAQDARAQFGQPFRLNDLVGAPIRDSSGQKIGTLKDLAIDLKNGRVVEMAVASGGFLGIDSKTVAALPQDFSAEDNGKSLRLNLTGEKLKNAPTVDLSEWQDSAAQPHVERVYQYYGVIPYFLAPEHRAHSASYLKMGLVEPASRVIGAEAVNQQNQKIGQVKDMVIDLSQGRLVEVIIASGQFLGIPGEWSAVPPQILRFDAGRNGVSLTATKDQMFVAPHFSSDAWPPINRTQAANVYQAWQVAPYFLPIGTETSGEIVPPVNNNKIVTAPEQGISNADQEITARIKKELMDSPDLSLDAKAVTVITFNGHVTLRGAVDSEQEKRRVGEIAARIVPVESIDNQLIVQQTASAAP